MDERRRTLRFVSIKLKQVCASPFDLLGFSFSFNFYLDLDLDLD